MISAARTHAAGMPCKSADAPSITTKFVMMTSTGDKLAEMAGIVQIEIRLDVRCTAGKD